MIKLRSFALSIKRHYSFVRPDFLSVFNNIGSMSIVNLAKSHKIPILSTDTGPSSDQENMHDFSTRAYQDSLLAMTSKLRYSTPKVIYREPEKVLIPQDECHLTDAMNARDHYTGCLLKSFHEASSGMPVLHIGGYGHVHATNDNRKNKTLKDQFEENTTLSVSLLCEHVSYPYAENNITIRTQYRLTISSAMDIIQSKSIKGIKDKLLLEDDQFHNALLQSGIEVSKETRQNLMKEHWPTCFPPKKKFLGLW
jgi:hypothetical protein